MLKPSHGTVHADGRIGYIPQNSSLLEDATVEENLRFFARLSGGSLPSSLPFSVDAFKNKKVASLSGGMKMQVSIACAMLGDPPILLLDEPCASLDITFREEMAALVFQWKEQGKTVLYVGHDPSEFHPFFDSVLFLTSQPKMYTREQLCCGGDDLYSFAHLYKSILENCKGE